MLENIAFFPQKGKKSPDYQKHCKWGEWRACFVSQLFCLGLKVKTFIFSSQKLIIFSLISVPAKEVTISLYRILEARYIDGQLLLLFSIKFPVSAFPTAMERLEVLYFFCVPRQGLFVISWLVQMLHLVVFLVKAGISIPFFVNRRQVTQTGITPFFSSVRNVHYLSWQIGASIF